MKPSEIPVVQLIFPGMRFANGTFDAFVDDIAQRHGGPISFVFQDSHSLDANRGKKRVYSFGLDGQKTVRDFAGWNPSADERVVILYDETNMQGGDFEPHSRASADHEVEQFIFCNVHEGGRPNRSETLSENDLLQAQRRRRGESQRPSFVHGTQPSGDHFLRDTAGNQKALEQHWALRDTAEKIARKSLKSFSMMETAERAAQESMKSGSSYDATHKALYTDLYRRNFERHRLGDYSVAAQAALRSMKRGQTFAQAVESNDYFGLVMRPTRDDATTLWRVAKNRQEIEHHAVWFRDLGARQEAASVSSAL